MSNKSKQAKNDAALDRPFEAKVLKKAQDIAEGYQIVLWKEDGEFYGRGLEMPNVFGDGKTAQEALDDCREALVGAVATLLELGERPPVPAM